MKNCCYWFIFKKDITSDRNTVFKLSPTNENVTELFSVIVLILIEFSTVISTFIRSNCQEMVGMSKFQEKVLISRCFDVNYILWILICKLYADFSKYRTNN